MQLLKEFLHGSEFLQVHGVDFAVPPVFKRSETYSPGFIPSLQSWSWEGEDILLRKLFLALFSKDKGYYVDIGAHHPFKLSNTALLYSQGWRGINIDATPGSMAEFAVHRPEDINLEIAIGPRRGRALFSRFVDGGLNGFLSSEIVTHHINRGETLIDQVEIDVEPINDVLSRHVGNRPIDLLTIDTEGLDLEILTAFDFGRWQPLLICTEMLGYGCLSEIVESDAAVFLKEKGYRPFSRLHFSAVFVHWDAYLAHRNPTKRPSTT